MLHANLKIHCFTAWRPLAVQDGVPLGRPHTLPLLDHARVRCAQGWLRCFHAYSLLVYACGCCERVHVWAVWHANWAEKAGEGKERNWEGGRGGGDV